MPGPVSKLVVLYPAETSVPFDAIRAYSRRLVEEIDRHYPPDASLHGKFGVRTIAKFAFPDALLLQYNAFAFGRWGFAPWLPVAIWRLRWSREPQPRIALMVHEASVPMRGVRWTAMGFWQRIQLGLVRASCDLVFVNIGRWADELRRSRPHRPTHHLPIPSNVPEMSAGRGRRRRKLGASPETLVLATFGAAHPLRLMNWVVDAVNAIGATRDASTTMLLNLASDPPSIDVDPSITVLTPGFLQDEDLAEHVAAADLLLLPWADGASTKRSTLMTGLQHAVAVVSTKGEHTDPVLLQAPSAVKLVPVGCHDEYVNAALALAADDTARAALAAGGRTLYRNEFDWPVHVDRLLTELRLKDDGLPTPNGI